MTVILVCLPSPFPRQSSTPYYDQKASEQNISYFTAPKEAVFALRHKQGLLLGFFFHLSLVFGRSFISPIGRDAAFYQLALSDCSYKDKSVVLGAGTGCLNSVVIF